MREIKSTLKDVPSSDINDLFFNSGKVDEFVTSLQHLYIDRFGKCHRTVEGMNWVVDQLIEQFKIDVNQAILAAGYAPVGSFQDGAEVKKYNETVLWRLPDGDGEYYRWDGDLPKSVPEGSTPESTGGIKSTDNPNGLWVSVGDASVRSDLNQLKKEITNKNVFEASEVLTETMLNKGALLSKIKSIISPTGMYFRTQGNEVLVGINMGDSTYPMAVEYRFVRDLDNLLLLRGVRSGYVSSTSDVRNAAPPTTIDGSFEILSSGNSFTKSVGATIKGEIKSNRFIFKSYQDDRGGQWLIRLTNSASVYEKTVSTWKETGGVIEQDVFGKIPFSDYSYTLTYLGADPYHEPSDGEGRGWVYYGGAGSVRLPVLNTRLYPLNHTGAKWLSSQNSIIDFAVSSRPQGAGMSATWCPNHGSVKGVSINIGCKLYIDGLLLSSSNNTTPETKMIEIGTFMINQEFDAKNANSDIVLWHQWITHEVNKNSGLSITNRLEFKANTNVISAYLGMAAATTSSVSRLVFDNRVEFNSIKTDNTEEWYKYGPNGVCYAGYFNPQQGISHGFVTEVNNGEASSWFLDQQPDNSFMQHWRNTDDVTKTYWRAAANKNIQAGTVLKCQTRHYFVTGVRSPNNELRVI